MEVRKHHYVPKCYLRGWTGADDLLCEYQRRPERALAGLNNTVVAKRKHPSETGWVDRLYTLAELEPEVRDVVERQFFQRVDQDAADALVHLRRGRGDLPERLQVGWVRFLLSLIHRHPSQIAHLRQLSREALLDGIDDLAEAYEKQRRREDPPTFAEYRAKNDDHHVTLLFSRVLEEACNSEKIGRHILGMNLELVSFGAGRDQRLITSDRPLLRAFGLESPDAFMMIPVSPRQLFVATNGPKAADVLGSWSKGGPVVPIINRLIARQAYAYVYGVCENHLELVEAEMGRGLAEPWRMLVGGTPRGPG